MLHWVELKVEYLIIIEQHMKHITLIAGARPNFMKIAPLIHAIKRERIVEEIIKL